MRPEDPDPRSVRAAPGETSVVTDDVETLVHELRAPLHAVVGFAELLLARGDRLDPLARRRALEAIVRNGRRSARLLEDAGESGHREVREEVVELPEAIDQVVRDLAITRDVSIDVPDRLQMVVDPDHLAEMLTNLLTDVRRHGAAPFTVTAARQGREALIGIDATGEAPESGDIGLAVARRLAALNGGSLTVDEQLPGWDGTARFVLRLPLAAAGLRAEAGLWRDDPPSTDAEHAAVERDHGPVRPPAEDVSADRRVQIERLELHRLGRALTATTGLRLEADEIAGTAAGQAGLTATVETVARATLAALEQALRGRASFELDRVSLDHGPHGHVIVRVRARIGDGEEELLLGAAMIEDDHERAALKATLGAVNRRFGHYAAAATA